MHSKLLLLFFLVITNLYSKQLFYETETLNLKYELEHKDYVREFKKFKTIKPLLANLNSIRNKSIAHKISREKYIKKLYLIYKKYSNSIFMNEILIKENIRFFGIKHNKYFSKYIIPPANYLLKYNICDGYLYLGIYEEEKNNNINNALKYYKAGVHMCKDKTKKFTLISRRNALLF